MKAVLRSRVFLLGLLLRIALLPFFGSYYLRDLFIPFIDRAVQLPLSNPWSLAEPHYFPYGSVLFLILYVPRFLLHAVFGNAALGTSAWPLAAFKLPLLGLDLLLLLALRRLAPKREDEVLKYYWLNPIVLFVCYVHGQLDVAAMAFCLWSLALLLEKRFVLSGVAFAFATLCKFHVVAIVPFVGVYLWNRHFAREARDRILQWAAGWIPLCVAGFLPLLMADRLLYASMSSPEAFRLFATHLQFGDGATLYVGLMLTLAILGRLCLSTRISEKGLILGSGMVLGSILMVTFPGPGWYLWILPFLCLFYATYANLPRSPFAAFIAIHLLYYGVLATYGPTERSLVPALYSNIVFTCLQTTMGGMLIALWILVVRGEAALVRRARPLLIGIAGDSGAGKNHLSLILQNLFTERNTVLVEGDDYHKWERGSDRWLNYTHLDPKANHLTRLSQHASELSRGLIVFQPRYDHGTGTFSAPREIRPTKTVILQGLHTLYPVALRRQFDIKIFIAPDERVRMFWKLSRDVVERGHSREKVLQAMVRRNEDSTRHIAPQKAYADWIIEYVPSNHITQEEVFDGCAPELAVRHTLWNDAAVSELVDAVNTLTGCRATVEWPEGDMNRLALVFSGHPSSADVARIGEALCPDLRYLTRAREKPLWSEGLDGLSQLLFLTLLRNGLRAHDGHLLHDAGVTA